MTVLSDCEIERLCLENDMIDPYNWEQLQPASYDVRLDSRLLVPYRGWPVDLGSRDTIRDQNSRLIGMSDETGYVLDSGAFVLAATIERVSIPSDIVGRIEGKSSLARIGLQIHSAGYLDPGFVGNVTLELVNFWPARITLRPGVLIAQLSFEYMTGPARTPYKGRYQGSHGVVGSRYEQDGRL